MSPGGFGGPRSEAEPPRAARQPPDGTGGARERARAEHPAGPVFWTGVLIGWTIIGAGAIGALADAHLTHPRSLAIWVVGCLIAHDFVLAPTVFAVGKALRRYSGGADRRLLQACLVLFAVLGVVSIPVLGRFGARPDNPTLLPRDYAVGLIVALVTAWIATTSVFVIAWLRRR